MRRTILIGDRPTGALHLGHYVGSLRNRVALQHQYETFVLIADLQALTDHADDPALVRASVLASDPADVVARKIMGMFTDPGHLRVSDPGRVEGNPVFAYLDAFDPDSSAVALLKERYRAGGLGDVALKRRLTEVLEGFLGPMRSRRAAFAQDPAHVRAILREGTARGRARARGTLAAVRHAMGLYADVPGAPD